MKRAYTKTNTPDDEVSTCMVDLHTLPRNLLAKRVQPRNATLLSVTEPFLRKDLEVRGYQSASIGFIHQGSG